MSRSLRKTKIFGYTCAESEKQDKRRWNRQFRKISKKFIQIEKVTPSKLSHVVNIWYGSKDGKHYVKDAEKEYMRK